MKVEILKRLEDARVACLKIQKFTSDLNFEEFQESDLVRAAVERQLEIIGEALGKALADDPQLEQSIPEIRRAIGIRNRLIHGYDVVDDEIVWDVVRSKLNPLSRRLVALLDPFAK